MGNARGKLQAEAIWAPSKITGLSGFSNNYISYGDFRRTLSPKYFRNAIPLFTSLLMISLIIFAATNLKNKQGGFYLISLLLLSILLGLIAHKQLLLVHEGAHFHLAKNRVLNDLLSNLFAGIFVGTEIKSYRYIHNKHHQELGNSLDPENSYAEEFDLTWIFTALLGIRVIKTLFKRQKVEQSRKQLVMLLSSMMFHLIIIYTLFKLSGVFTVLVWILGFFIIMPFFGSIRNILEHKFQMDVADLDNLESSLEIVPKYTTRIFTKSYFSKILGVAGFDRHLIHHWDPSIAAINLGAVNNFLLTTELGPMLRELPTTYTKAFLRVLKK